MKYILLTLLLFIVCCQSVLFAQSGTPSISEYKSFDKIPSPDAASLGKYGQIPVSLYTGQANIQIPLYTIHEKGINIPIGLIYNATGNKVNQNAGWTGLGWTLPVGAITRKKSGEADDCYGGTLTSDGGDVRFRTGYYLRTLFNQYHQNDRYVPPGFHLPNIDLGITDWATTGNVDNGNYLAWQVDRDPDEFTFNFNGISGSFFLDGTNKWQVKSDENTHFTVESEFSSLTSGGIPFFSKFKITDASGNVYVFGGDETAIEHSWPESLKVDPNSAPSWISLNSADDDHSVANANNYLHAAMSWFLKEIILPNGQKIEFNYEKKGRFVTQNLLYGSVNPSNINPTDEYSKTYGDITYLKNIVTENQNISFTSSLANDLSDAFSSTGTPEKTTKYKLDLISIYKQGATIPTKTINLNYIENANERLKLNRVTIDNNQIYNLTYNPSLLPSSYISAQTDHWGYFNNGSQVNLFLSQYKSTPPNSLLTTWSNSKTPNGTYAQAEILTSIEYPTKGKSSFYYEGNDYSKVATQYPFGIDNTTGFGGGVRISKIVNEPLNGPVETKEYFYVNDYLNNDLTSSGVLDSYTYYGGNYNSNLNWFNFQNISLTGTGQSVRYSTVTEKHDGGFTVYKYSNYDNGYQDSPAVTQSGTLGFDRNLNQFNSLELERGKLLLQTDYNSLKQSVHTIQNLLNDAPDRFNKAIRAIGVGLTGGAVLPTYLYTNHAAYLHYYYTPYIKKTVETFMYSNNVSTTTEYVYDSSYNLLKQVKLTDSKGNQVSTYFNYPFDVAGANYIKYLSITTTPIAFLKAKHMIGMPVEQISTIKRNDVENITAIKLNTFKGISFQSLDNTTIASVIPNTLYLDKTRPILKSNYNNYAVTDINETEQDIIDAVMEPRITYSKYDAKANLAEIDNVRGNINKVQSNTSQIWGYNFQYVIAQITNASVNDVFHQNFEETEGNSSLNDAHTGHKSKTGGYSTTLTGLDAGSYILSYWTKSGSLWVYQESIVNVTGTSYPIGLSGQIDDVRFYPVAAQMITYTYDPLIGITSMTDAKGMTTTYEYDSFQRLMNVKDKDGNIVKNYSYNYSSSGNGQSTVYKSAATSITLPPVCQAGYTAGPAVTYTVSSGTYTSTISQADADSKAQADLNANGQAYANANGTCTPLAIIYAKISVENTKQGGRFVNGDVMVRFYADAACTQPFSAKNMVVYYKQVQTAASDGAVRGTQNFTVTCTGVVATLSSQAITQALDPNFVVSDYYSYYLTAGAYQDANPGGGGPPPPPTIYKSAPTSVALAPVCQSGFTPGPAVTYALSSGAYTSSISQADADSKAQADLNANGQAYANAHGTCTPPSGTYARISVENIKQGGRFVTGNVVVRFYSDAAGTQPLSVSNIVVNYKRIQTKASTGAVQGTQNFTFTCNGNTVTLASGAPVQDLDPNFAVSSNYDYSLTAGVYQII
ncbi:DUF5977 domain-containing protein [Mucilaginibacter lappiensis]|uniref:YD repeat-containing protein n=1 Tax=Mucilaginibacter lappiensis TaxID=354630 RepID=A0A841JIM8_9SPHI|nr:DUF5977 domain-containing protein [Mucilaginibacter lappiensis]MBB6130142.1 YD repeat-containing protein [Mucilaginibacter lappiensis]